MIIIGNALMSDELYQEQFVCDLPVCKGGCCVEGDAGAPLEEKEIWVLNDIYPLVKPFMIAEGITTIEDQGPWLKDREGEYTTPLVKGKQCAYVFYDDEGIAKCAIEKAHDAGLIDFRKPISCHLYPIRVTAYPQYDALNYHRWPICNCARKNGKKLKVKVYRFLKDALIRKYGEDWYAELDAYVRQSFETS
jgi:hypothetical protein